MCKTNKKNKTKKLRKFNVLCQAWQLVRLRECRTGEICMTEMPVFFSTNDARIVYYLPVDWKCLLFEKVTIDSEKSGSILVKVQHRSALQIHKTGCCICTQSSVS